MGAWLLGLSRNTQQLDNVELGLRIDRSSLGFIWTTGNNNDVEVGLRLNLEF